MGKWDSGKVNGKVFLQGKTWVSSRILDASSEHINVAASLMNKPRSGQIKETDNVFRIWSPAPS